MNWTLEFDGGASPNPGRASYAFRITGREEGMFVTFSEAGALKGEPRTNNEAEWTGLLRGMSAALSLARRGYEVANLAVTGDSELVLQQLAGKYAVKNERLLVLHRYTMSILDTLTKNHGTNVTITHRPREENEELDSLCKSVRAGGSDA